jgi:hypothetical protein
MKETVGIFLGFDISKKKKEIAPYDAEAYYIFLLLL